MRKTEIKIIHQYGCDYLTSDGDKKCNCDRKNKIKITHFVTSDGIGQMVERKKEL